ncbi:acyltransferase family protein [Listeria valentina]|uniref:acyltransferase family protein n=1 Tax=Listeria valentina TaxID=2705293 RepID=UPI00142F647F|nr:acyltransferase [Listeria valentina]
MSKRIYFLDSLRGIAAVTVVATHLAGTFKEETLMKEIFEPLGRSAVILFFLLSGIALSLALKNKSPFTWQDYAAFLVKRICRIYLPFLVIILLTECLYFGFTPTGIPSLSAWFNTVGSGALQWKVFLENVFMVGNYVDRIDPVIWSLIIELRISIVFPLFYYLVERKGVKWGVGLIGLSFGFGTALLFVIDQQFLIGQTIFHLGFFIIGILMTLHWEAIRAFTRNQKVLVMLASMALYFHGFALIITGIHLPQVFSDVVIGTGCVGILLVCYQSKKAQDFLARPVYLFLGKISFSVYLVHCVVFIPWIYLLHQMISSVVVIELLSLPLIFIVAYLSYLLFEKPAQQFGRKLGKQISQFHLQLSEPNKERTNG